MPDLKDTYLNLIQQGYKPEDIEKFIKEMKSKPADQVKPPKPQGPQTKPISVPKTFGSEKTTREKKGAWSKAIEYLASTKSSY